MPRSADKYPAARVDDTRWPGTKRELDYVGGIDDTVSSSGGSLHNLFAGIPILDEVGKFIDSPIVEFILDALADVPLIGPFVQALTGILNGGADPLATLGMFGQALLGFIPGLGDGSFLSGFDPIAAATAFISNILNPVHSFVSFVAGLIPGLDASKITSGSFPMALISGLTSLLNAFPGGNIIGQILSSVIPGLDASKITSGSFPQAMVSGLTSFLSAIPGGNIVGTILASIIPGLDASKITSGSFPQSIVSGLTSILNAFPGGNIIGQVLSSVIPGLDASKITSGSFPQSIVSGLTSLLNAFPGGNIVGQILASVIPGLDASKITSGNLPQTIVTGLTTVLNDLGSGVQGAINGIFNSLQGATGAFWTQADANAALSSQAAATAAAAAALAQIQASQNNDNNGGLSVIVDFSDYPDSPTLPSNFTQTYIGGSSGAPGAFGVLDGKAGTVNNESPFAIKVVINEFNLADTVTDYQRIGGVWANAPGYSYQNPTPYFTPSPFYNPYRADSTILVRYKDVLNWTQFRFLSANQLNGGVCILETSVNGTVTELTRVAHSFQPSTNYWFEAGTPTSLRMFRVICGSKVILSYTDTAAISQVGAAFRGASFGGTEYGAQGAGVPANPARMLYFAIQDNSPAGVVGSGARVYRAATSGIGGPSGAVIANNTLDTIDYLTSDYTWTPGSNCRLTVSKTDWYIVAARMAYNAASNAAVRLYRNGVIARTSPGSNGIFGNGLTSVMYLQAGDYVQVGLTAGATIVGSAGGADTYLEMTRVGKAN